LLQTFRNSQSEGSSTVRGVRKNKLSEFEQNYGKQFVYLKADGEDKKEEECENVMEL